MMVVAVMVMMLQGLIGCTDAKNPPEFFSTFSFPRIFFHLFFFLGPFPKFSKRLKHVIPQRHNWGFFFFFYSVSRSESGEFCRMRQGLEKGGGGEKKKVVWGGSGRFSKLNVAQSESQYNGWIDRAQQLFPAPFLRVCVRVCVCVGVCHAFLKAFWFTFPGFYQLTVSSAPDLPFRRRPSFSISLSYKTGNWTQLFKKEKKKTNYNNNT